MFRSSEAGSSNYTIIQPPESVTLPAAQQVIDFLGQMAARNRERKTNGFLIDLRYSKNLLGYFDTYRLSYDAAVHLAPLKQVRIAVLIKAGDLDYDYSRILAEKLELYLRLFEDEEECEAWLDAVGG